MSDNFVKEFIIDGEIHGEGEIMWFEWVNRWFLGQARLAVITRLWEKRFAGFCQVLQALVPQFF